MIGRDPVHKTLKPLLTFAGLSRRTLSLIAKAMRALGQQTLAGNLAPFGNTRTIDYWRLCEQLLRYRQNFADAMANAPGGPIDCILGPACALPAFHHGATAELGVGGANTGLYNVLGYPAGVVPVARVREGEDIARPASRDIVVKAARNCDIGSAGLPVGVQVAAKPWQEHIALAVMRVIETAACQGEEFPSMSKLPL
jgi:fatty acid amide hydrolase